MANQNYDFGSANRALYENPLPNESVDPRLKATQDYGKKVAKAIYYRNRFGYYTYDSDKQRIKENRRYGEGLQTINKYKPTQSTQGDRSIDNLDYSADSITAKYVDVVIGDMIDRDYDMNCEAIDPDSYTEKDKIRKKYFANLLLKEFDRISRETTGVKIIPDQEFTPENKEELDIYMQMNVKLGWEIAMEEILKHVFEINNWEEIQRRVARDMVENKFGSVRVYYDEDNHIRIRYSDIDNVMVPRTEYPDFRDVKYQAEFRRLTIGEIRELSNGDLSEQDLFDIARDYAGRQENFYWGWGTTYYSRRYMNGDYQYDNYQVDVLDFVFYTHDTMRFREKKGKNGQMFFDKRNHNYRPKDGDKMHDKTVEVAYQGYWIIGSDYLFAYKKINNQLRERKDGKYSASVLKEFLMYAPNLRDMTNKSMVERIRPHADRIQLYTLRLQHIISKIPPPGVSIDITAVNDIIVGGKTLTPEDIVETFFRDGTVFYDSMDDSGERRNYKPVEVNQVQIPQIQEIVAIIQYELLQIENVTGINSARDASSPDKDALVGTQQIAYQGSLNATKEIYEGMLEIQKNVAKKVMRMVQDKVTYGMGIKEFKNIISRHSIEILEITKGLTNAEMGIFIQPVLDEQDKARLDANISLSLQAGEISVSDAERARRMKNVKLAGQFLDLKRKQHIKEATQAQAEQAQAKAAFDQQSAQQAAQMRMGEIEVEFNKEINLQNNQAQLDEAKAQADHMRNLELAGLKGDLKIEDTIANNTTKREDIRV